MSALQIEYRSLESLIPYVRNARTHSDEQVGQIAGSIKEFGFTNPVLIDEDGGIIAGHGHATPKPVAMMERCMRSSLPDGGLCFEPFGGSGSTLIGAEKTGRLCYTMELLVKHVDVIVRRWEAFTGKKATLDGDGRTFEEIAAERTAAQ